MKVGFDLDGVIAKTSIPLWLLMGQVKDKGMQGTIRSFMHTSPELKFHPREFLHKGDEYVIITAREKRFQKITEEWLRSYGIYAPVFYCDAGTSEKYESVDKFFDVVINGKAQYIKSKGIDVYFEDSPAVVAKLRKLCPEVVIVQVGGRLK